MKRLAASLILIALLFGSGCGRLALKPASQRRAGRLAADAIKSLGGRRALAATRFLVFDFAIQQAGRPVFARSHTWDRKTGRCRLEGTAPDGQPYVALFNINTRQGKVFTGAQMQPAADQAAALETALRDHRSDTAWLLAPFRLLDDGVMLDDAGQQAVSGRTFNVISATTSGPAEGALPGRQNWVFLDPVTARPFAWVFIPEGSQERVVYLYTGFATVGKLTLPARLDRAGSPWSILFGQIISLTNIGDNVFESVSGPLVQKVRPLEPGEQQQRP